MVRPASPEFIPAHPTNFHSGDNKPLKWYVIHSAVSACEPGVATSLARMIQQPNLGKSWHYASDPVQSTQSVGDSNVAYHCGYNYHSLGHEMADTPGPVPGDKRGTAAYKSAKKSWRWVRPNQIRMLNNTAHICARNCLAYNIPLRFVSVRGLKKGKKGITTHANMSKAFHKSDHWDPGFWPRPLFMQMVRRHAREIRKNHA